MGAPIHAGISRGLEELTLKYHTALEVSDPEDLSKIGDSYQEAFSKLREKKSSAVLRCQGLIVTMFFLCERTRCADVWFSRTATNDGIVPKLAEIDLIHEEIGEYPILLLDDVLSELDDYRQSHLLHTIQGRVQTFVTTTSVDGIDHETLRQAGMFRVQNGALVK